MISENSSIDFELIKKNYYAKKPENSITLEELCVELGYFKNQEELEQANKEELDEIFEELWDDYYGAYGGEDASEGKVSFVYWKKESWGKKNSKEWLVFMPFEWCIKNCEWNLNYKGDCWIDQPFIDKKLEDSIEDLVNEGDDFGDYGYNNYIYNYKEPLKDWDNYIKNITIFFNIELEQINDLIDFEYPRYLDELRSIVDTVEEIKKNIYSLPIELPNDRIINSQEYPLPQTTVDYKDIEKLYYRNIPKNAITISQFFSLIKSESIELSEENIFNCFFNEKVFYNSYNPEFEEIKTFTIRFKNNHLGLSLKGKEYLVISPIEWTTFAFKENLKYLYNKLDSWNEISNDFDDWQDRKAHWSNFIACLDPEVIEKNFERDCKKFISENIPYLTKNLSNFIEYKKAIADFLLIAQKDVFSFLKFEEEDEYNFNNIENYILREIEELQEAEKSFNGFSTNPAKKKKKNKHKRKLQ